MDFSPVNCPSDFFTLQSNGSTTLLTDSYNDASGNYLACPLSNSTQHVTYVVYTSQMSTTRPMQIPTGPTGNIADCIPMNITVTV